MHAPNRVSRKHILKGLTAEKTEHINTRTFPKLDLHWCHGSTKHLRSSLHVGDTSLFKFGGTSKLWHAEKETDCSERV
jgi:hypothetical protein